MCIPILRLPFLTLDTNSIDIRRIFASGLDCLSDRRWKGKLDWLKCSVQCVLRIYDGNHIQRETDTNEHKAFTMHNQIIQSIGWQHGLLVEWHKDTVVATFSLFGVRYGHRATTFVGIAI